MCNKDIKKASQGSKKLDPVLIVAINYSKKIIKNFILFLNNISFIILPKN